MDIISWIFFTKVLIYTVMTASSHPKPINSTWTEFEIKYDSINHDTIDDTQGFEDVHSLEGSPVHLTPTNCSIITEHSIKTDTANIIGNTSTDDVVIKKLPITFVFPEWASSLAIFLFLFVLFYIVWFTCPLCDEPNDAEVPYVNTVS